MHDLYVEQIDGNKFLTALNKNLKFYGKYIPVKYPPKDWDHAVPISDMIIDAILNGKCLDGLLAKLIQEGYEDGKGVSSYFIALLIKINTYIAKGGKSVEIDEKLKKATGAALRTVDALKAAGNEKKAQNYRKRLATALLYNDKKMFLDLVMQLSAYANISYPFLLYLLDDFDGNINVAYAFTNALLPVEKKATSPAAE